MHVPRPEIWRELRSGCRTSGVCPCGPLSSRWGDWLYPKEGFMTFGSLADVWYLAHACQSKAQTSRFNPFGDLSGSSGPLQPETGRSWAKSRTGAERKERNPGTLKHDVVYGIYTYIIIYNHTYALMWACLKLGCPKIWWVDHHTHSSHKTRHSRSFQYTICPHFVGIRRYISMCISINPYVSCLNPHWITMSICLDNRCLSPHSKISWSGLLPKWYCITAICPFIFGFYSILQP